MKISSIIYSSVLGASLLFGFSSCEEYLDKEADTDVSEDEAFKNFNNFQGYVEQEYFYIPNKESCNWCPSWNWGDDEIFNPEADSRMTHQADLGNFRAWTSTGNWLYRTYQSGSVLFSQGLYTNAYKCIRIANMGIDEIENGTSFTGTQEQKDFIKGQLLFFRAWWHYELACYLGGLPYIDRVFGADEKLDESRLTFQETALRCAEDFAAAAELLPINWDETSTGRATKGSNDLRINKIMALGYEGKALLWAASPLAVNGAQLGASKSGVTYQYDKEIAARAGKALGQIITLVEGGETQYALTKFEYTDIYNHKNGESLGDFSSMFYTVNQSGKMPGSTEAIFRGPIESDNFNYSNWNNSKVWGPKNEKIVEHDNVIHQPTANYVNYYGMANGLPLDDPDSGFDPTHPWKDRDPRFYHDIVFDGFKYINGTMNDENQEYLRYCSLYTGGAMRDVKISSRTGYFIQKLVPHTCNAIDGDYNWGSSLQTHLPYMRLADIYLMYAEAECAAGSPNTKAEGCSVTALQAINTIRERCGAGDVNSKYSSDNNKFMDEVRRERAVELSFEGFRFCDLQRWLLLTESDYTSKYSVEFDRVVDGQKLVIKSDGTALENSQHNDKFTRVDKQDPKDAEVANYRLVKILTRDFNDTKYYWFPIPTDQTYYSENFPQNPGW